MSPPALPPPLQPPPPISPHNLTVPSPPPPPDQAALAQKNLNLPKCRALLADPTSRFHDLWAHDGWAVRHEWDQGCWGDNPDEFFAAAMRGDSCGRNWYEGNNGPLGYGNGGPTQDWVWPHFSRNAPALLGFDENIDGWCHSSGGANHAPDCVRRNYNILSLYPEWRWNVCRNFEWQLCAALGRLPGQGTRIIRFAFAPKNLQDQGNWKPLGDCQGWHPRGCWNDGYASSDVFYLEACMYAVICTNGHELFNLEENQDWWCNLSDDGYDQLKAWLLQPRQG